MIPEEDETNLKKYEYSMNSTNNFKATKYENECLNIKKAKSINFLEFDKQPICINPENSLGTLKKIQSWRQQNIAPVDVVGCERLHDKNEPIDIQKYQILIALILSVQTKDETTAKVMTRLKQKGLRPEIMANMNEEDVLQLIRESNFNKRKSKSIIEISKRILEKGIAKTKEEVLKYPGVGEKVGILYLKVAEGISLGIGVDTHVHRISNRLGWVKTKIPTETELQLQNIFPEKEWEGINIALVGFGQTLCGAKRPKCEICPVSKECPSSTYKELF